MTKQTEKEKDQVAKFKALRRELEERLEEQLPEEMITEKIKVQISKVDETAEQDPQMAKSIIEALLFASSKPLSAQDIKRVLKSLSVSQIGKYIDELKEEYVQANRSFEIVNIANGYEISTRREYAPWIMKVELQKKAKQVTQSALECLAILAYKQPITRAEIEELRGVDVSGVLGTLTEKGLVKIVGKKEVPGRPFLYGTTEKFLEHFGLGNLKDLPDIQEIKTLVESSVKREELFGASHIVPMEQGDPQEQNLSHEDSSESSVPAEGAPEGSTEEPSDQNDPPNEESAKTEGTS